MRNLHNHNIFRFRRVLVLFIAIMLLFGNIKAQKSVVDIKDTTYQRVYKNGLWGYVNNFGDTIIPFGKYKFLNHMDDKNMILGTSLNGKQGYIDIHENIIIPFEYSDLGIFSLNLAQAKRNRKYGYINRDNKVIIAFKFSDISYFYRPGIAVVKAEGKYGIIDTLGKQILPIVYSDIDYNADNQIAIIESGRKWAFYNALNKTLSAFKYDYIYEFEIEKCERTKENKSMGLFFKNGLALVEVNKQYALIDASYKEVVAFGTYDKIEPMNFSGFSIVSKDGKYGILDDKGNIKVNLEYTSISNAPYCSYCKKYRSFLLKKDNKFRLFNSNTEDVLLEEFDKVEKFNSNMYIAYKGAQPYLISDQLQIVSDEYDAIYSIYGSDNIIAKKGNKMGLITVENKQVLPFVYDTIEFPSKGPCIFVKKNGFYGVVDLKNNNLIPFEYEMIVTSWHETKNGDPTLIVQKNYKLGTVNLKNEIIIPFEYNGISSWVEYGPKEHYVSKGLKYGLISGSGKVVVPVIYDYLYAYYKYLILVGNNNKYGIINTDNETIVEMDYDILIVNFSYFFIGDKKEPPIIGKKGSIWYYIDFNGDILKSNVPEQELKEDYRIYSMDENFHFDEMLVIPNYAF